MPRYRVSANLVWNVEGDTYKEAEQRATEFLLALIKSSDIKLKTRISMNRLKDRPQVKRLAEFMPEDVLPFIGPNRKDYQVGEQTYKVKMNSHRYFLFSEERKCVVCGVEGTRMVLELPPGSQCPHFNFYAIEGGEYLLMTKDHKVPKSLGGKNSLENYQTMCAICNGIKGSAELSLEDIKALREIYNTHRDKTTPSQLYQIIAGEKEGRTKSKSDINVVTAVRKVLLAHAQVQSKSTGGSEVSPARSERERLSEDRDSDKVARSGTAS